MSEVWPIYQADCLWKPVFALLPEVSGEGLTSESKTYLKFELCVRKLNL